jgi:hypothetical protein
MFIHYCIKLQRTGQIHFGSDQQLLREKDGLMHLFSMSVREI